MHDNKPFNYLYKGGGGGGGGRGSDFTNITRTEILSIFTIHFLTKLKF